MRVGVLGSGMVGQAIGAKLIDLGHDVVVGTRDPGKLQEWLGKVGGKARAGSFADAAAHGEIVFNCAAGVGSLEALKLAGERNLKAKVLLDVSNPLDFSKGMPPTLSMCNTDSVGEQIQLAGGDHDIFVSGNDATAKAQVTEILKTWFGWKNVIDLGDITTARGVEMYLPLWLRLWGALQTPMLNLKIVR